MDAGAQARADGGKILHSVFLVDSIKQFWLHSFMRPLEDWLVRHRVNPNIISTAGLIITFAGSALLATDHLIWAGWFLIWGGCCDFLDGRVARRTQNETQSGAFYDSCLDRYMDVAMLIGCAILFYESGWLLGLTYLALLGTTVTPYVRAKSESLNIQSKGGEMQRPERIIYIAVGALLSGYLTCLAYPFLDAGQKMPPYFLIVGLAIVALQSNRVAIQRIRSTFLELKRRDS